MVSPTFLSPHFITIIDIFLISKNILDNTFFTNKKQNFLNDIVCRFGGVYLY